MGFVGSARMTGSVEGGDAPSDRLTAPAVFTASGSAAPAVSAPAAPVSAASRSGALTPDLNAIHARNEWLIALDQAVADVRSRSRAGKLTTPERWVKLALAPAGVDGRAFAHDALSHIEAHPHAEDAPTMGRRPVPLGYDDLPELDELSLDDPLPEPEVTDIAVLSGASRTYLYATSLMSYSFAHALFNTAEGDDLATFADAVRSESRIYPRPVAASCFLLHPYLWSAEKVAALYERATRDEAYADIELVKTSLGESFFYSTRHLSAAQGKALAEWHGVEKHRNP